MDSKSKSFLIGVLGKDGSDALEKAASRAPILEPVLVPRAIVSWLDTAIRIKYDGEIPGIANSYISIYKHESGEGFDGMITVGEVIHPFENASVLHVAASIGVAIGINDHTIDPMLKSQDISRLGKDIDLLVKAKVIAQAMLNKPEEVEKEELPGQAHAPREAAEPTAPAAPQKQPALKKPKLPITKRELPVLKSESIRRCGECGGGQFKNDSFVGCLCFRALAKSTSTVKLQNGNYLLKFTSAEWDSDSIQALVSILKG